jgi:hypothetical protein
MYAAYLLIDCVSLRCCLGSPCLALYIMGGIVASRFRRDSTSRARLGEAYGGVHTLKNPTIQDGRFLSQITKISPENDIYDKISYRHVLSITD